MGKSGNGYLVRTAALVFVTAAASTLAKLIVARLIFGRR
jgi:hypothetical protein